MFDLPRQLPDPNLIKHASVGGLADSDKLIPSIISLVLYLQCFVENILFIRVEQIFVIGYI